MFENVAEGRLVHLSGNYYPLSFMVSGCRLRINPYLWDVGGIYCKNAASKGVMVATCLLGQNAHEQMSVGNHLQTRE